MHHQVKLDVFIIRAFALLSETRTVSSNLMSSVTSSPQTSTTTPSNLSTTNLPANTGSSGKTGENSGENESNDSKNGTPNHNSSHSGSTPTAAPFGSSGLVNTQFMRLFLRISKLYNATLNTGSIDDRSTSPKSSIELYQRFQQIIRELGLSYEESPYAKYFTKINEDSWKIKSDEELANDNLWNLATMSILNVYDPESGQMIVQGRGKKAQFLNQNSKRNEQSNSTPNSTNENDSNNETNSLKKQLSDVDQNTGAKLKKRNVRIPKQNRVTKNRQNTNVNTHTAINDDVKNMFLGGGNQNNVGEVNSSLNNMLFDSYLQQQLQKRLQSVPQDINSRSLNGYYTQPTSPGVNNFEFGFGNDLANAIQNGSTPTLPFLNTVSSNTTNPMAAALNNNNNTNNPNNGVATSQHGNHNWKRRSLGSLDVNTLDDDTVEELLQLPNVSQKKPKFMNESDKQAIETTENNEQAEYNDDRNTNNEMIKDGNMRMQNENAIELDSIVKQMKDMYESIVSEKGERIVQLERELELQRQETQWLRKMLIEDMGCVRSMLKDLQR